MTDLVWIKRNHPLSKNIYILIDSEQGLWREDEKEPWWWEWKESETNDWHRLIEKVFLLSTSCIMGKQVYRYSELKPIGVCLTKVSFKKNDELYL